MAEFVYMGLWGVGVIWVIILCLTMAGILSRHSDND